MGEDYYIEIEETSKTNKINNNLETIPNKNFSKNQNKLNSKIILPSEKQKIKSLKSRKRNEFLSQFKWPLIITTIILIYIFYQPILLKIMSILKSNPTIYSYYLFIQAQISNNTLSGLLFTMILGSLFFLALPSEAIFIYFLDSTNYNFLIIIILAVLGNLIGLIFNYSFGRLLGERVVRWMFKKNFWNYKKKIEDKGGLILLFGNILPGPIEVLSIFYGSFKFNFKNYIFLAMFGRLIKFILLFLAFTFYWDQVLYFYNNILDFFNF